MGTLYALTERAVLKAENGSVRSYPLSFEGCVYNGETKTAAAFTFGFEEAGVYVLSDGFIVKTDAPQTASLKNLAAGDTYEQIFTNALTEESVKNMTLITLPADSVLVSLDGQNMEGDVLPYNGYRKTETEMTGVVLAETEFGTVAAFYDGSEMPKRTVNIYPISKAKQFPDYIPLQIRQSALLKNPKLTNYQSYYIHSQYQSIFAYFTT